eukprot:PLAT7813.1.p1 GENE.PLAT7813.1~~PLAT7813.1.p1  ORF type:complete len:173 (-),score=90.20 PLAT7813.1:96-614(-)
MAAARALKRLDVALGGVTDKNLDAVRRLNLTILPVRYSESFYSALLTFPDFCRLAWFNGLLIGNICCRLERKEDGPKVYIMTLGVLPAYRGRRVGTQLLEYALKQAREMEELTAVYLHVQTNNEAAIDFYARFGFEKKEKIEGYYKRLDPPDCYILELDLAAARAAAASSDS